MAPITKFNSKLPVPAKKQYQPIDPFEVAENAVRRTRIFTILALIIGLGLGGFVMWEHDKGNDVIAAIKGPDIKDATLLDKEQLFQEMQTLKLRGMTEPIGKIALNQLTNDELLMQFGKQNKAYPTQAQVDAQFDEIKTLPQYAKMMATESPEHIKKTIRLQLIQANLLSKEVTVSKSKGGVLKFGKDVTVSKDDVLNFYKKQIDPRNPQPLFYRPATVTISIISTQTEQDCNRALDDLNSDLPFATVAKKFSTDASKWYGGQLGTIAKGWSPILAKNPDFENLLFSMRIGETRGPVPALKGTWWIIHCQDKTDSYTLPFDKVRAECEIMAKALKGGTREKSKLIADALDAFKKKAKFQAFWTNYSDAFAGK